MTYNLVGIVDMWVRQEKEHQLTPCGRRWKYANPKHDIPEDTTTLDIEVVDVESRGDYIVALLHEEDKEIPVPLDIAKGGTTCCKPGCANLRTHLQKLWESRSVTMALKISDPRSQDPFSWELNDNYFDPRTNDLYLRCVPTI